MAIGTAAAIGLGLGAVGAVASSGAQRSAAKTAANTSEQNNAANIAFAREAYGNNQAVLSPYFERGNVAGNQLNAMLGLGGAPMNSTGNNQVSPNALSQFVPAADRWGIGDGSGYSYGGPRNVEPQIPSMVSQIGNASSPYSGMSWQQFQDATEGMSTDDLRAETARLRSGRPTLPNAYQAQNIQPSAQAAGGQTAQGAADDAFDIFRNSTNYQFRLNEGLDAVNSGYAGAGMLQSGAALRGVNDYAQNMASNELANYMGLLSQQQAVGAGAASSLAGVGQNFAGTVINSNNLNAANQANAQLAAGYNNPWNSLANLGGTILGNTWGN